MRATRAAILVILSFFGALTLSQSSSSFESHLSRSASSTTTQLIVDFSLRNLESFPLTFVTFRTPFDVQGGILSSDAFTVRNSATGAKVGYIGRIAKRAVTTESLLTIAPGATLTVSIDIGQSYDLSQIGTYLVSLDTTFNVQINGGGGALVNVNLRASEVVTFTATTSSARPRSAAAPPPQGQITFQGCSAGQITESTTAAADAAVLVQQAIEYLSHPCSELPVYNMFFGPCDATRFAKILADFQAIQAAQVAGYIIDCSLTDCPNANTYAFVYRADTTHVVHLCALYSSALTGQCKEDSQAGVLIHELSHFADVANTDDVQYGRDENLQLAINDPAGAVRNADSHEYFAEECPVYTASNSTGTPRPTKTPSTTKTAKQTSSPSPTKTSKTKTSKSPSGPKVPAKKLHHSRERLNHATRQRLSHQRPQAHEVNQRQRKHHHSN